MFLKKLYKCIVTHQSKVFRSQLLNNKLCRPFGFSIQNINSYYSTQLKQLNQYTQNKLKVKNQSPYLVDLYSIIDDSLQRKSQLIQQMLSSNQKNVYKLVQELIIVLESFNFKRDLLEQNLVKVISKFTQKIVNQSKGPDSLIDKKFIIFYIQTVKSWVLTKVQDDQKVGECFQIINEFINNKDYSVVYNAFSEAKNMIYKFIEDSQQIQFEDRLRMTCLLPYLEKQKLQLYFSRLQQEDLVKHMKKSQLIVFMYDCCNIKHQLSLQLVTQIQSQQFYQNIESINEGYIKSQFSKFVKNSMTCYHQTQFYNFFKRLRSKLVAPTIKTLLRILKIFQTQASQYLSDFNRHTNGFFYNDIVVLITSQNYTVLNSSFKDLLQLHLTLCKIYPCGQALYDELIKFLTQFLQQNMVASCQQIELSLKVFKKINFQIASQYKYQKIDLINSQYSQKSQSLNNLFMKLLVKSHPQIILINSTLNSYINQNQQNYTFVTAQLHKLIQNTQILLIGNQCQRNIKFFRKIVQVVKNTQFKLKIETKALEAILSKYQKDLSILLKMNTAKLPDQKGIKDSFKQVYNILTLVSSNQRIQKQDNLLVIIEDVCIQILKVIKIAIQQQNSLINTNKKYYNYLILIFGEAILIFCKNKPESKFINILKSQRTVISQFINKKLIFSIKCNIGVEVIKMINFLNAFKAITHLKTDQHTYNSVQSIIFRYIYPCLSTLIRFVQQTNKYYIKSTFSKNFKQIVQKFSQNKKLFKQINQKSDLTMLQILLVHLFKKKYINLNSSAQLLLDFMEIFKSLQNIGTDLQEMITVTKFNSQLLQQYSEELLIQFSPISDSITNFLNQRNISSAELIKLQNLTAGQIQETFKQKKMYQIIFKSSKINMAFQIPQPSVSDIQTHMLYICQKIYQKIAKHYKYDFIKNQKLQQTQNKRSQIQTTPSVQLDFSQQKSYILRKSIVSFTDFNQFKLETNNLPKIFVTQVWKKYLPLKAEDQIQKLSITEKFDNNLYRNVILGIFGFQQKIKELASNFHYHGFITFIAYNMGLQIKSHGCILNLFRKSNPLKSVLVICAVEHNYKLLNICAYILEKSGYNVVIINEKVLKSQVKQFLQQNFPQVEMDQQDIDKQSDINVAESSEMTIQTLQ